MRYALFLIILVSLAGCATVPPPAPQPPVPRPKPLPTPVPPPVPLSANWQDWPITLGSWALKQDARGSFATFGKPGTNADFMIRCVFATKGISLSRAGTVAENGSRQIIVRTTDRDKTYSVVNDGNMPAAVSAETAANDPQLDAIAFSRGRFLVSMNGAMDLVIPVSPEFARIVEDCRV